MKIHHTVNKQILELKSDTVETALHFTFKIASVYFVIIIYIISVQFINLNAIFIRILTDFFIICIMEFFKEKYNLFNLKFRYIK